MNIRTRQTIRTIIFTSHIFLNEKKMKTKTHLKYEQHTCSKKKIFFFTTKKMNND